MSKGPVRVPTAVLFRRLAALIIGILVAVAATDLFIRYADTDGMSWVDIFRCALIAVSTAWLAWGASLVLFGLTYLPEPIARLAEPARPQGRTAVLIPVYNEDPVGTFSRIAAMDQSLAALGATEGFDFAILSDSTSDSIAEAELAWWARLVEERHAEGRIFYRRRASNVGRKAGNIEDFFRRSGGAYDYALILDADSLMEGATMVEMVRRMEASPELGLLQTLPAITSAQSIFGRAMQFSGTFFSPVFARGLAMLQGYEGPFWGHNALVRTVAWAESCGLPALSGKPPFGGHIMSHDYVEAAMLARAGWRVRLDPDLTGSYEESPQNLLEHARRDRRWCQGNLQYVRLIGAPGLRLWSRFVFAQAIMAYVASPIWLAFLIASIASPFFALQPDYFPEPHFPFPIFPVDESIMAVVLAFGIWCLLIVPKLLIVVRGIFTGDNRSVGGTFRALTSTLAEVLFSSLTAPLMLWYQSRAVLQVLLGADGGWGAANRGGGRLSFGDCWRAAWLISLAGLAALIFAIVADQSMVPWLIPITGPMIIAPVLIWAGSQSGHRGALGYFFLSASERAPTPVIVTRERILAAWEMLDDPLPPRFLVEAAAEAQEDERPAAAAE